MTKIVFLTTIWFLLALQLMLFFHEMGHLLTAWVFRVKPTLLDIYPVQIPSALFESSSYGSLIVWNGVILGSILPIALWPGWKLKPFSIGLFLNIWTRFCLTANGLYLCFGIQERFSDSGLLLSFGWSRILVVATGGGIALAGYWLLKRKIDEAWTREFVVSIRWKDIFFWSIVLGGWVAVQFWIASWIEI